MEKDRVLLVFEDKSHPSRHQIFRQKRSRADYQIKNPFPIVMVAKMMVLEIYLLVARPA
jgi:uncharacterized protein YbaR (Trm112 family)